MWCLSTKANLHLLASVMFRIWPSATEGHIQFCRPKHHSVVSVEDDLSRWFLVRNVQNGVLWLLSLCVAGLLLRVQLWMRPWHTVLPRCFCLKAVFILWLCALFGQYGLFLYVIIREGIIQQFCCGGTRAAVKIPSVDYTHIEHTHCDALYCTLCLALIHWCLYF